MGIIFPILYLLAAGYALYLLARLVSAVERIAKQLEK